MKQGWLTVFALAMVSLAIFASLAGAAGDRSFPRLNGPYLGQEAPGREPRVFAEGIIRPADGFHSSVVFSARGDEAYWTAMGSGLTYRTHRADGVWSAPEPLPFDPEYGVREPMLADADRRLYYLSRRPLPDDPVERERIWYVEREGTGWSSPRVIAPIVAAHPTHWQFSFTRAGDLYFTSEAPGVRGEQDIYVARRRGDRSFAEPVSVGVGVNTDAREFCPFVSPDESYLLFARTVPPQGRSDLFVSFRRDDGRWGEAVSLGNGVNSGHNEVSPVVTADGRYLFFLRASQEMNDVYWVGAGVIDSMR